MSFIPYTADMPTGYFVQGDIYMTYTEYYGNGTVYGLRHIHNPDGSPGYGLGPGLTRADLEARGMIVPEERADAVPIDVSVVPPEDVCAAAQPPAPLEDTPVEVSAPPSSPAPTASEETEDKPAAPAAEVVKGLNKVIVKLGPTTVVLNTKASTEITVNVNEADGVVEFVL